MERKYDLAEHKVVVHFEPKLIRIMGTDELLAFLNSNLNAHTLKLVKLIKADYLAINGKPLKITNASLMVEIWGHLYTSKFATAVNQLVQLSIIEQITKKIIKRSETIDCGEAEVDSNRKFWDTLGKFKSLIVKLL